jgi:hypothetical protein
VALTVIKVDEPDNHVSRQKVEKGGVRDKEGNELAKFHTVAYEHKGDFGLLASLIQKSLTRSKEQKATNSESKDSQQTSDMSR